MSRPSTLTRTPLASRLNRLLLHAGSTGQPATTTLQNGLTIRAAARPSRLCLWREKGQWGPGEVSEREAHVCARALGWGRNYTLSWSKSGKYLTVTQTEGLL